jgi:hypothetical protein
MSKIFQKIGVVPKWGNVGYHKILLASHRFQEALSAIRRKKTSDPTLDVSQEIRNLLEERK